MSTPTHSHTHTHTHSHPHQIGDYLLTLPQQLDPFTSQDSPALLAALKAGRLPYPDTEGTYVGKPWQPRGFLEHQGSNEAFL